MIYYDTGTLNADGSMNWNAETSYSTTNYVCASDGSPSITIPSGNVWASTITGRAASCTGTITVDIDKNVGGVWSSSTTFAGYYAQMLALTAGKVAVVYGTATPTGTLSENIYSSGWGTATATSSAVYKKEPLTGARARWEAAS